MPQIPSGFPLVGFRYEKLGDVIKLSYRDRKGQTRTPSTSTRNPEEAKTHARILSDILVGKLFDDPPADTPQFILDSLGIKLRQGVIDDELHSERFKLPPGKVVKGSWAEEYARLSTAYGQLQTEARKNKENYDRSQRDLADARQRIRELEDNLKAYEAARIAEGLSLAASVKPVTLAQARLNYLGEGDGAAGTRAKDRFKKTMRNVLKNFGKKVGESRLVMDVKPAEVIDYLEKYKKTGVENSTVRKAATGIVLPMLEHCSGGLYNTGSIRQWLEVNVQVGSKGEADWYWLTPEETAALLKVAKAKVGEYWADAMALQWYLALRPEEIPLIQSANVMRGVRGGITHVYVCPLMDGKILIRDLKTPDSTSSIPVDDKECKDALKRRIEKGSLLLFPRDHVECGGRKPQWHRSKRGVSEFEKTHLLWHEAKWCLHYLEKLREVIALVPTIKKDMFDGRTLRRTRGKEFVVRTRSIETAAAFLRDVSAVLIQE